MLRVKNVRHVQGTIENYETEIAVKFSLGKNRMS